MGKQVVRVCDVCERSDRPLRRYSVTSLNRTTVLELCSSHAKPLETLLSKAGERQTGIASRIVTMDELEQMKKRGEA